MKIRHVSVAVLAIALVAPACSDDSSAPAATRSPATTDAPRTTASGTTGTAAPATTAGGTTGTAAPATTAGATTGPIDITDIVFSKRDGDCAAYDATYVAFVDDLTRNVMFEAGVTITADADACILTTNGIPNHDFDDASAMFADPVAEVPGTYTIPRHPQPAARPTALSQRSYDGVMLNGVPIDLLSAGCYRPDDPMADANGNVQIGCFGDVDWLLDPLGVEGAFGADEHNAHTQPGGLYHYHGNPMALFDDSPGPDGSPVIGFAADGFPIFGSYFLDPDTGQVRKAESGWSLEAGTRPTGDGNPGGTYDGTYVQDYEYTGDGDLDECNGMTVDGQYGYYVTDAYPWILGCLTGTPDPSFDKGPGG